jgi:hypothetical protein
MSKVDFSGMRSIRALTLSPSQNFRQNDNRLYYNHRAAAGLNDHAATAFTINNRPHNHFERTSCSRLFKAISAGLRPAVSAIM